MILKSELRTQEKSLPTADYRRVAAGTKQGQSLQADLKEGFLQVELDEESSILTTFQTPWGRYRFHRMPFGIAPAPEIFQMKLDQNLEGLSGVFKIADDILITG